MKYFSKIIFTFISINCLLGHGVSESTASAMSNANLMDFIYFGGEHMVTGYDHILFLIGVLFFLTNYFDILKFITAFTIAHCLTLIFATYFQIDAVIAFSVIYKGFENLDGFKKIFSTHAPNLLLMVFIFGLIHGFGLSTKLQEVAVASDINLSLSQILSFNVGVEFGQIIVLLILYPILSLLRGYYFNLISKVTNWSLIVLGFVLLVMQLNGFFHDISHDNHIDEIHHKDHHHDHDHHH